MDQKQNQKQPAPSSSRKPIAVLSYIGILFLVPLLVEREDEFVQYHAKQGLTLFIAEAATMVVAWIPVIGWLASFVGWILWIVFSIMGIANVVNNRKKNLPLIGGWSQKLFG